MFKWPRFVLYIHSDGRFHPLVSCPCSPDLGPGRHFLRDYDAPFLISSRHARLAGFPRPPCCIVDVSMCCLPCGRCSLGLVEGTFATLEKPGIITIRCSSERPVGTEASIIQFEVPHTKELQEHTSSMPPLADPQSS